MEKESRGKSYHDSGTQDDCFEAGISVSVLDRGMVDFRLGRKWIYAAVSACWRRPSPWLTTGSVLDTKCSDLRSVTKFHAG